MELTFPSLPQSRMNVVAPNLSVIVGTAIASQLIGIAGGLHKLSKLPANVIQTLGKARKTLGGFSASTSIFHGGFLLACDLVKKEADIKIRRRALRLVAGKVALAARVDATTIYVQKTDTHGIKYREVRLGGRSCKGPVMARAVTCEGWCHCYTDCRPRGDLNYGDGHADLRCSGMCRS